MFKISRNFLLLLVLYFLGYTHFLGGPYSLAKFFFILFLIGTILFSIVIAGMSLFAGRIIKKRVNIFTNRNKEASKEDPIKVDAKIVE